MHERIRDALLQRWGRTIARHPRTTLALCLALAGASLTLTATSLEFHSDRSDLVDPSLWWNRNYAEYKANFSRWDSVVVCLEGDADRADIDALTRAIVETVGRDARVETADGGLIEDEVDPRLFVLASDEEFEAILGRLRQGRAIAAADHANQALAVALGAMAATPPGPDGLDDLQRLLDPYLATLRDEAPAFDLLGDTAPRWRPLVSSTGRMRFIQVQFADIGAGIDRLSESLAWLRETVAGVMEASGPADVAWGVTGIPAIEADETAQSIRDSTISSIIAFAAITMMMIVVFRGVRVPLLAASALLIGMAWSFGWLVLTVGHLQLLSVVFSVILLGLGIDFALHLVARLELVQDEHDDLPSAIARVFRGIGPGMLTGAVTTAAAFAATALTDFKGMAEMGVIAGGGILLCLVAVLSAFPAGLALTGRWKKIIRHRAGGEEAHFAHGRLDVVDRRPWPTLVIATVLIAVALAAATRVRYDPNVLNLHAPGIESVVWEKRLVADDARSVWSALISTTPRLAPILTRQLRELPTVSDVGGMGILYPSSLEARRARVDALRSEAAPLAGVAADLPTLQAQLATVRSGLAIRAGRESGATATRLGEIVANLDVALSSSRTLDADRVRAQLERLEAAFASARRSLAIQLERALAPEPVAPDDLPGFLREQWVGDDGAWLLRVFPADDTQGRSVLDPEPLRAFVESIRSVAPNVLGPPVQILESNSLIIRAYKNAALYAVLAIIALLLLDFRSLADSLCAIAPVGLGFIGVFGIIGIADVTPELRQYHRHADDLRHRGGRGGPHGPSMAGGAAGSAGGPERGHRPGYHADDADHDDRVRKPHDRPTSRHSIAGVCNGRRSGGHPAGVLHRAAGAAASENDNDTRSGRITY